MNFIAYWFSDKMVLKRYQAHELKPGDQSRLYSAVEDLSKKANIPMPGVYIIPQQTPNAFATGRNPSHAAVAVTEGIVQLLDDDELDGVIAHELSHIKNRDILTGTIAATLAGAIALLGQMARYSTRTNRSRQNPLGILLLIIGAPLAAVLIRMMISRVREYSADADGAHLSGNPLALAGALGRLQQAAQQIPLQRGNPAHAHMFTVNPFLGGLQRLFSTHPPVEERIKRLRNMAVQPGMAAAII
jgi:heat shock protein HtpX